jgi:hypothetical protein
MIAIHIAFWAIPQFAVQVCYWVFELLTTGKIKQIKKVIDINKLNLDDFFI